MEIHCAGEQELASALPVRICARIFGSVLEEKKSSLLTDRISRALRVAVVDGAIWIAEEANRRKFARPQQHAAAQTCGQIAGYVGSGSALCAVRKGPGTRGRVEVGGRIGWALLSRVCSDVDGVRVCEVKHRSAAAVAHGRARPQAGIRIR